MGDIDWKAIQLKDPPQQTFYVGQWSISHDDGATWHGAGADCPACKSTEGKTSAPTFTVVARDDVRGEITIQAVSPRTGLRVNPPRRPR